MTTKLELTTAENERLREALLIERGVANVACHFLINKNGEPKEEEECPCQSCSSLRDDAALAPTTPEGEESEGEGNEDG